MERQKTLLSSPTQERERRRGLGPTVEDREGEKQKWKTRKEECKERGNGWMENERERQCELNDLLSLHRLH